VAQQGRQIGDVAIEAMRLFDRGLLREAEPDHIRHDHAMTGCDERRDEIAVEKPPGGISMQQHDGRTAALVDIVHAPAIDAGEARCIGPLSRHLGRQGYHRIDHCPSMTTLECSRSLHEGRTAEPRGSARNPFRSGSAAAFFGRRPKRVLHECVRRRLGDVVGIVRDHLHGDAKNDLEDVLLGVARR
jgi:hypothetical protein